MSDEARRVVVDPVTRIEGHLRIEVATDAGRRITQAYSSGTMVRGLEIILRGRDPRDAWAFAQRICGVCTLVHGIASVRAVEDALRWEIPPDANLVRNLMIGAQYVHDHVMHFYHLHALDWVDVVSALQADPKATSTLAQSISSYARSSPGYFADVQQRVKGLVESGQLGIFANGYWGHPAYKLPPEANLMAVAHYLDALAWQRDVAKLHAIFGGKNPHPHFVVGGVPNPIDLESDSAINARRLSQVQDIILRMREFVDEVYVPDTLAIAGFYKDWAKIGGGLSGQNVMSYGDFPDIPNDYSNKSMLLPSGVILGGDLTKVLDVDLTGYFLCAREAARVMLPNRSGAIIQINSKSGKKGSYKSMSCFFDGITGELLIWDGKISRTVGFSENYKLKSDEKWLLKYITKKNNLTISNIKKETGFTPNKIHSILSNLETKGLIECKTDGEDIAIKTKIKFKLVKGFEDKKLKKVDISLTNKEISGKVIDSLISKNDVIKGIETLGNAKIWKTDEIYLPYWLVVYRNSKGKERREIFDVFKGEKDDSIRDIMLMRV